MISNKIQVVLILLIFASIPARSQAPKKNIHLFLYVGAGSTSVKHSENLYPIITPRIAYNFKKVALGMEFNHFKASETKADISSKQRGTTFGLFSRFRTNYVCIPFLEGKVTYGAVRFDNEVRMQRAVIVSPGWDWRIGDGSHFYIDGIVDLIYGRNLLSNSNVDLNIKLGISYKP